MFRTMSSLLASWVVLRLLHPIAAVLIWQFCFRLNIPMDKKPAATDAKLHRIDCRNATFQPKSSDFIFLMFIPREKLPFVSINARKTKTDGFHCTVQWVRRGIGWHSVQDRKSSFVGTVSVPRDGKRLSCSRSSEAPFNKKQWTIHKYFSTASFHGDRLVHL